MIGITIRCFTSLIAVPVLVFGCLYLYIISFHRIKDFEDYVAISKTISAHKISNRCRRIDDQNLQCLPNVLLIGASKCGTTSLVEYLSNHANIKFVNRRIHREDKHKEVHRFDRNTYGFSIKALDLADEWASSPLVASENTTVIHYTPHYLYAPTVPYEMKRFYPHADALKFIVILRDPIARAWSSYWFHNSHLLNGLDGGSTEEFLKQTDAEILLKRDYEACMTLQLTHYGFPTPPLPSNVNSSSSADWEGALYAANRHCFGSALRSPSLGQRHLDKGVYIDQVRRWYASFHPSQFMFITLEEFTLQPQEHMRRLLEFMNTIPVIPTYTGTGQQQEQQRLPQTHDAFITSLDLSMRRLERPNKLQPDYHAAVPATNRSSLSDFYRSYNTALRALLGINTWAYWT